LFFNRDGTPIGHEIHSAEFARRKLVAWLPLTRQSSRLAP
jgi:hypothetical protein